MVNHENTSKINYITGLKGLACFFVMLGHFVTVYRSSQSFSPSIGLLDRVLYSDLAFLPNASYWLYLFLVVSGYLLALSDVTSLFDVFLKSVVRFFRLAIPVFFAYLTIYLLYKSVGFYNAETSEVFKCTWYQNYYNSNYTLFDVFSGPFYVLLQGKCSLNAPYWVLKMMLISSILIYLMLFLLNILEKNQKSNISSAFISLSILFSAFIDTIITAHLLGLTIAFLNKKKISNPNSLLLAFSLLLCLGDTNILWAMSFLLAIYIISNSCFLNKFFSSKFLVFLGTLSWGIYSFHWPVFCSIGAIVIIALSPIYGLMIGFFAACFVTVILTLVLSLLFSQSFEKISDRAIHFIKAKANSFNHAH